MCYISFNANSALRVITFIKVFLCILVFVFFDASIKTVKDGSSSRASDLYSGSDWFESRS
jgi:hypothetical protein